MTTATALADILLSAEPGFASGDNAPDGVVQLRMNNVLTDGTLDWSSLRRVPADEPKRKKYALQADDVMFNSTNSAELVGKTALFEGFTEDVLFSNHFLRLRVRRELADPAFIASWLNFQWDQRIFERLCTRWVNQAAVRRDDLLALAVKLPSLPEQQRLASLLKQAERLRRLYRYRLDLTGHVVESLRHRTFT
jgi:type I restriction enzyme, S subunit